MTAQLRDLLRLPPSWRLPALAYVVLEAVLAAVAFSGEQAHPRVEVAAFLLALPVLVVAIPFVYVLGAVAWGVRDQLAGHPMWPVTLAFTVMFAATACANVLLLRFAWSGLRRRRERRDECARSPVSPPVR